MRKSSRWQQAPALAVSLVALFAAITGAAAALPGTQSVNSGDIKNESVKTIDLKDGKAVGSADVIDDSLLSADIKNGEVSSADVKDNTLTGVDVALDTLQANDLAPNSVTSSELADNAVTTGKVADDAVTTGKIAADAVTTGDIANGQVRGADLSGVTIRSNSDVIPNGASALVAVNCAAGETMLSGGGFFTGATQPNKGLQASFPGGSATWAAVGRNNSGTPQTFNVNVVCLTA